MRTAVEDKDYIEHVKKRARERKFKFKGLGDGEISMGSGVNLRISMIYMILHV